MEANKQSIRLCICHYRQNDSGNRGGRAAMQVRKLTTALAMLGISCTSSCMCLLATAYLQWFQLRFHNFGV